MGVITGHAIIYASDEPVGRVARRHALTMLHRGVATVREAVKGVRVGPYELPESLDLIREIDRTLYARTGTVSYSRSALLIRDRRTCGYCGGPGETMDHILPKSRGGRAEWLNAIVACTACNQRKADRTPEEAGMMLLRAPFAPTYLDIYDPVGRS